MELAIQYALSASVPLVAGAVLAAALNGRSAAVRHSVIAMSIAAALSIPALSFILPAWHVLPRPAPHAVASRPAPAKGDVDVTTEVMAGDLAAAAPAGAARSPVAVERFALWTWALGTSVILLFMVTGLARLRWLAAHARPVSGGPWRAQLDRACAAAGVPKNVRLLQSDHRSLLATWGSRRPTIYLPAAARTWPADRIRIVLVHELAHVARRDWLWQLAAELLRGALWFNPLVWLAARQLRIESERACDDVVLESGIAPEAFAGELASLVRALKQPRAIALPAPAMARPSSLEGRVQAMLNTTLDRRPASRVTRGAVAALLFALALPVATIRAQAFYTFSGQLSDSTGRSLPNATLTVRNQATGQLSQIQSDAAGHYQFVGLPSAAYTLDVKLMGFETLHVSDLAISGDTEHDWRLSVGSLQETVTVSPASTGSAAAPLTAGGVSAAERLQKMQAACVSNPNPAGGHIVPPLKLVDVPPMYPDAEKVGGVGGIVTMDAVIGADGIVSTVENLAGGDTALQNAAADAVRQWQYSQTLLNCEPIPVRMKVTVNFRPAASH